MRKKWYFARSRKIRRVEYYYMKKNGVAMTKGPSIDVNREWCNAMCISLQYTYEEVKHSFEFLYQTKTLLRRSFTIFLFLALLHRLQAKKEIFLDIIESFWITLYDPKNVYIVWCCFFYFELPFFCFLETEYVLAVKMVRIACVTLVSDCNFNSISLCQLLFFDFKSKLRALVCIEMLSSLRVLQIWQLPSIKCLQHLLLLDWSILLVGCAR